MVNTKSQIQVYIDDEGRKLIIEASKKSGLKMSSFIKHAGILYARKILKENQEAIIA